MHRKLIITLLAFGAIGGFASGFASLGCRAHARRAAFERHVASVCVDAARKAEVERTPVMWAVPAQALDR
ncbi:hypothetical protein [Chondromyces crocatus]|uniref:Uncharacterized protein n=1 Tax=Chondromyces crocatus TaxID=52 RepID=A0A0K1EEW3_CHOCO|nr:hypothetical protein [Chondromyces crocatus]AKT39415.1 uncharacterized protein CMC5_035620 [Chondromyces crocatus]